MLEILWIIINGIMTTLVISCFCCFANELELVVKISVCQSIWINRIQFYEMFYSLWMVYVKEKVSVTYWKYVRPWVRHEYLITSLSILFLWKIQQICMAARRINYIAQSKRWTGLETFKNKTIAATKQIGTEA